MSNKGPALPVRCVTCTTEGASSVNKAGCNLGPSNAAPCQLCRCGGGPVCYAPFGIPRGSDTYTYPPACGRQCLSASPDGQANRLIQRGLALPLDRLLECMLGN